MSTATTTPSSTTTVKRPIWRPIVAIIIDLACIVVFSMGGRSSHFLEITLADLTRVSTPFIIALLVGSVITGFWKTWDQVWPAGIIVWAVTLGLGSILRVVMFQNNAPWSFVVVTGLFLALLLLGRRIISALISRQAQRASA